MEAAADHPPTSSTRVVRGFAFLDLCGFTDFVDRHGDDAAVAQLRALRWTVRDVTPRFGVRVDKWLGDGLMLVGVEAAPLVAAVLAVGQGFRERADGPSGLHLRGGLAVGAVILLEGDDYVGRCVNLASRLCDAAQADEVLAAASPELALPAGVQGTDRASVPVKGFAEPVTVLRLVAS